MDKHNYLYRFRQTLILIAMLLEAITVLARQEYHVHVTRALRPIFFIDNLLMDGVRRSVILHDCKSNDNGLVLRLEKFVTF